jgi:uncharacterized protein YybS (DUF2232 family)
MPRLEVILRFLLATGSTVLLFISGAAVPAAGLALFPLVPQPVLSFGVQYGLPAGIGVVLVALGALLLLAGGELAFVYSMFALVIALIFSSLGRIRAIEGLVSGITAAVLTAVTGSLIYLYGSTTVLFENLRASLESSLSSAVQMQEKMGFPAESVAVLKEGTPQIAEMILRLLPAVAFISVGLMVLFNVILLCRRFPEQRAAWLSCSNLKEWKAPEWLVWGLIGAGFVLFVPGSGFATSIAANVLLVLGACYFFQGLAIVNFFFHKNHVPRFVRAVVYLFIVFQQVFTLLVAGLGLFDLWIDFRRLRKQDLNPSRAS